MPLQSLLLASPDENWTPEKEPNYDTLDTKLGDKLSELDLEQYAQILEAQEEAQGARFTRCLHRLQAMKMELRFPFRDPRPPFRGLDAIEM